MLTMHFLSTLHISNYSSIFYYQGDLLPEVKSIIHGHTEQRHKPKELHPGSVPSPNRNGFQRPLPVSPPCTAVQPECEASQGLELGCLCASLSSQLCWPRLLGQPFEYQRTQNKSLTSAAWVYSTLYYRTQVHCIGDPQ